MVGSDRDATASGAAGQAVRREAGDMAFFGLFRYTERETHMHTDLVTLSAKLLLAAILGGLIGIERGESNTPAGLRTNMIIAMSTCLFTILGQNVANSSIDSIEAHIVSGVGFLGAGVIFHRSNQTKGLTTAATVWLVAGVGMAVGLDAIFIACFATVAALVILHFLEPLSQWLNMQGKERELCRCDEPKQVRRKAAKRA
jgi:putative Mg2+ transporter-C (MgtC) family protein